MHICKPVAIKEGFLILQFWKDFFAFAFLGKRQQGKKISPPSGETLNLLSEGELLLALQKMGQGNDEEEAIIDALKKGFDLLQNPIVSNQINALAFELGEYTLVLEKNGDVFFRSSNPERVAFAESQGFAIDRD